MGYRFLKLASFFLLFCVSTALAGNRQPAALGVAGIYGLGDIDPNLTGAGVNIGLVCRSMTYNDLEAGNDYRPDTSHSSFEDLKISFHDDEPNNAGISAHATAIASILTGFDPNVTSGVIGEFSYEGACPEAKLQVYEFRHFLSKYIFSGGWPNVDLISISLGSSFDDWWTRGIDNMAEDFGTLVIASIGNGQSAYDLPLYPAAGYNILAVGVADSAGSLTEFGAPDAKYSTMGPTADGRCKPDIVAPGNCLAAVAGSKDAFALSGDYSSFAAPVVAGVAGLLIQKAKSDPALQLAIFPFTSNCVMKSILMTGARKLSGWHKGFPETEDDYEYPLDLKQGAGIIDGVAAYNILTASMQTDGNVAPVGWTIGVIDPNYISEKTYKFKTDGFAKPRLATTIVWNVSYNNDYPFELSLDNWADLQLELWSIDKSGNREIIDFSNSPVDNVEHIYNNLEPNTEYELVVSYSLNSELPKVFTVYAISWQVREE